MCFNLLLISIIFSSVLCTVVNASVNILPNAGFEAALNGWDTSGGAVIYPDKDTRHTGLYSARVSFSTNLPSGKQSISQPLPVVPGGKYLASVWIKCAALRDGNGGCVVIEFLRNRNVIASQCSPSTRLNAWQHLAVEALAPKDATSMRVVLTTDTQGDTWFDDCRISCPRSDTKTVTLHLDSKHIITDHWQGFGFSGDIFPFAPGMTDADRRLIRERVRIMRPQLVRVYCAVADWEAEYGKRTPDTEGMRRLCETLDIYKQAGADIQLHEWGYTFPEWCRAKERTIHPEERRHFTDSFADMVKYLRDDRGFSNIKYVTIYNEPNWGGVSWEDYAAVYRSLDASLKSAGLREQVAVLGPDEANERKWLPKAVSELNDAMDCYEVHNYTCDTGSEFGSFIGVRVLDLPASRSKTMVPPRKRLVISEFGMCDGMSTWENPNVNSYKYGMFLADSAIAAANAGVSGMLVWCLMDVDFGGDLKWGLWKSKSEGWEPRPGYYAWSLITRYTERDSMVYPLQSDAEGVDAVAFHAPVKGSWTLLAVNRQTDARPFRILGLPAASKWQPFIYCKESVPALDRKMIPSSKLIRADRSRNLTGVLPGNSFVLWHETK